MSIPSRRSPRCVAFACALPLACLLPLRAATAEPAPLVTVTRLDLSTDDGALLHESRALQDSLTHLDVRLEVLADQARILGDGKMLACVSELGVEATALSERNAQVYTQLVASVTEEDGAKRLQSIRLTEIIRDRALRVDLAEDDCMGIVDATYVDRRGPAPVWEQAPDDDAPSQE